MKKIEHTPGEWTCSTQPFQGQTAIIGGDGFRVAVTSDGNKTRSSLVHEANAAFIVRACNNHAELVAALARAEALFTEALPKFNWGQSALDGNAISLLNEVPGEVRQALAKATGRK